MDQITTLLNKIIHAWRSRFSVQGPVGKIGIGCSTLLLLFCMCSVPIAIIMPDPDPELEPAASERTQVIALDEEDLEPTKEQGKEPTQEPQATYTDQPTYTPEPTYTVLPTHTPLPPNTPLPTSTNIPTKTPAPTNTRKPVSTATSVPPTSPPPTETPSNEQLAVVSGIVDGDTFDIIIDGKSDRVRMIGINADEYDQQCGQEAASALGNLILGQEVRLVKDVSERDVFDRLLRYVYRGDLFVNAEMIRQGYAFALEYPPDVAQAGYLASQETGASVPVCRNVIPPTQPPAEPLPAPSATAPPVESDPQPVPTESPPPPQPSGPPAGAPEWCTCTGRDYDCKDFGTHSSAQACYNYCVSQGRGDYYNLDGSDNDGLACESLPG